MPKLYDETVNLAQGGDNGQNTNASVQPIGDGETDEAKNLNRSVENLRIRTETIRRAVEDQKYFADYDRSLLLVCAGVFGLIQPVEFSGQYELTLVGDDLIVYPALTPGYESGGRAGGARMFTSQGGNWVPYAGVLGASDLSFVASSTYTGMRGYADGDSFTDDVNALTVGANRLTITLVANPALAGGTGTMTATVTGDPQVNITITYGTLTPTTINNVISFVNGDTTSQGTWGLSNLVRASTTSVGSSTPPTITNAVFQGAYDAEGHRVTPAQLSAFFSAMDGSEFPNRLRDGDSLAIAYGPGPVESGPVQPKGGRRQAIFDLPTDRVGTNIDNTSPGVGWNLFNTSREPEKIPGSIPIGKYVNGRFIFIDGTILFVDEETPIGGNSIVLHALAVQNPGASGASLVGYDGSGSYNADAVASTLPALPASTVKQALDNGVLALQKQGTGDSGARRVGAEAQTGTVSQPLHTAVSLAAGSLRQQLLEILEAPSVPALRFGSGGLNRRVSENGHDMVTKNPLQKITPFSTPVDLRNGGSIHLSLVHNVPPSSGSSTAFAHRPNEALLNIAPVVLTSGVDSVTVTGGTNTGGGSGFINVIENNAALTFLRDTTYARAMYQLNAASNTSYAMMMIWDLGSTPATVEYYWITGIIPGSQRVNLVSMDRTTVPDFTGRTVSYFYMTGVFDGQDNQGRKIRIHHLPFDGAVEPIGAIEIATNGSAIVIANLQSTTDPGTVLTAGRGRFRYNEANERDTDNILVTGDKVLLSGVETSTPVNATANHHHGGDYTRMALGTNQDAIWFASGTNDSNFTLSNLGNATGDGFTGPSLAGFTVFGYEIAVELIMTTTTAAAALDIWNYEIMSTPGPTFSGLASEVVQIAKERGYKATASSTADIIHTVKHVFVRCNASRQVSVKATTVGANVDDTNSSMKARIIAIHAYK